MQQLPQGPEVFVQPFDKPGDRIQVSRAGGIGPIWRADGRELFYEGQGGLMAVAIAEANGRLEISTPQRLFDLQTSGFRINLPHNVEVTSKGERFLVNTAVGDSNNVPIEVTLNWISR
jgi:hypothetical protein